MAGQEFIKKLGKFGCALFLLMFIGFLLICFFSGRNPLKNYTPPESSEYYSEHIDELAQEINDNIAPQLNGITECYVEDGKVVVTAEENDYFTVRSALFKSFDKELFVIRKDTSDE